MRRYRTPRFAAAAAFAALLLLSTVSAHAAGLAVYPPVIALESARDPQRATAVFTREDGVSLDVTAQAGVHIEPATLAK